MNRYTTHQHEVISLLRDYDRILMKISALGLCINECVCVHEVQHFLEDYINDCEQYEHTAPCSDTESENNSENSD